MVAVLLAADLAGDVHVDLVGIEPGGETVMLHGEDVRAECGDVVEQLAKAAAKAVKALEKAPADEKLKLAAEAAEKAAKAAAAGELIPETFEDYLNKWVYGCKDQAELLDKIGGSRLMRLKNEPHLGYSTTH